MRKNDSKNRLRNFRKSEFLYKRCEGKNPFCNCILIQVNVGALIPKKLQTWPFLAKKMFCFWIKDVTSRKEAHKTFFQYLWLGSNIFWRTRGCWFYLKKNTWGCFMEGGKLSTVHRRKKMVRLRKSALLKWNSTWHSAPWEIHQPVNPKMMIKWTVVNLILGGGVGTPSTINALLLDFLETVAITLLQFQQLWILRWGGKAVNMCCCAKRGGGGNYEMFQDFLSKTKNYKPWLWGSSVVAGLMWCVHVAISVRWLHSDPVWKALWKRSHESSSNKAIVRSWAPIVCCFDDERKHNKTTLYQNRMNAGKAFIPKYFLLGLAQKGPHARGLWKGVISPCMGLTGNRFEDQTIVYRQKKQGAT